MDSLQFLEEAVPHSASALRIGSSVPCRRTNDEPIVSCQIAWLYVSNILRLEARSFCNDACGRLGVPALGVKKETRCIHKLEVAPASRTRSVAGRKAQHAR
eukprot:gnl/TRDRNA2_/TRDRNA2_9260_c0_seq1.p1 gnl/TRDRNA2_/TRDRNA2_9260_c0~~gnl/TRDRNA2_/TRDRNA2_9260_c0_seq1.p1  ORF type:complete len:113 (+),score=5.10 gnl/TRDRNA2_/TRDRNA2_9260_c0_seq1:38-340(+)